MGLDVNNKKTDQIVDQYGLIVSRDAMEQNDNKYSAVGDSIGNTCDAYIAYEYEPFIQAVKNCFLEKTDKKGKKYIQGYRHPIHFDREYNDMSRDHISYTLIMMKLAGEEEFIKKLSKGLRWKISDRYSFSIDLWLWLKGIAGSSLAMFFFFFITIPVILLSVLWNKLIYALGGFGPEVNQDDYVFIDYSKHSKRKQFFRKLIYPIYAIFQNAFILYATPDSIGKSILKKIFLWNIDPQNFMLRIMFGGKVKKEDVYSYKSMSGTRFTSYLSDLNDRCWMSIIKDPQRLEANVIDVDLLRKMYEKIGKK
jgi:hypothetical protein